MAGLTGIASNDLGLGADLSNQVNQETEEERKKRLAAEKNRNATPVGMGLAAQMLGLGGAVGLYR